MSKTKQKESATEIYPLVKVEKKASSVKESVLTPQFFLNLSLMLFIVPVILILKVFLFPYLLIEQVFLLLFMYVFLVTVYPLLS